MLKTFFTLLTEEQRNSIKVVSADGAKWIAACIDPFHVVEWVNAVLNKVRIDSWNDAKKNAAPSAKRKVERPAKDSAPRDTTSSEIKGSKYALGKIPENLTPNQQAKLHIVTTKYQQNGVLKMNFHLYYISLLYNQMGETSLMDKSPYHLQFGMYYLA